MSMRISSAQMSQRIATDIVRQQAELANIQSQIASGKKVNTPSDDPAQAGRLLGIEEASARLTQFDRNASSAEARLNLEETALTGMSNALMRARELALSSTSGAVDDQARAAIGAEVEQRLSEIYDLGNVRDSNGDYLFSGTRNDSEPFSRNKPVSYAGNSQSRSVSIGLGREVRTADNGSEVFLQIREGNGSFAVSAGDANTGTATIAHGSTNDSSLYDRGNFQIQFTSATSFDIVDSASGTTLETGQPYVNDGAIEFRGISTSIKGNPQPGDEFNIEPAGFKDMFSTVDDLVVAMNTSAGNPSDRASVQQQVNNTLVNLDQALEHVNVFRSRVGSRLNGIESSRDENSAVQLQLQRTQAEIEDVDIATAVTQLQSRVSSLEILQKSFVQIESLSLFNYM